MVLSLIHNKQRFSPFLFIMKKVSYLIYLWLVCCLGLQAQSRREMGGIYYAYPVTDNAGTDASAVKAPAGFSPYYISHYGRMARDGCRGMNAISG